MLNTRNECFTIIIKNIYFENKIMLSPRRRNRVIVACECGACRAAIYYTNDRNNNGEKQ